MKNLFGVTIISFQTGSECVKETQWLQLENCVVIRSPPLIKRFCSGNIPLMMWECELNLPKSKKGDVTNQVNKNHNNNFSVANSYKDTANVQADAKGGNMKMNKYNFPYFKKEIAKYDTITLVGGGVGLVGIVLSAAGIFHYRYYNESH